MRVAFALCFVLLSSCGEPLGPPRPLAPPIVDPFPALRDATKQLSPRNANYKIDVTLQPLTHQLTATQVLTWTNTGATAVSMLPFHLYLNAFRNDQSLFMVSSGGQLRGVPQGGSANDWGYINIASVQIAGSELVSQLRFPGPADDRTVVELPLTQPVEPNASITITMRFTSQLPKVFARTGYAGDFHMVGQWFPKIGVRVGAPGFEQWDCPPFHSNSEFFADFGTYDVNITAPNSYSVFATGVRTAVSDAADGSRTHSFNAQDVHDFAWVADPFLITLQGEAKVADGTVVVRVVSRQAQRQFAKRHLAAAIGAIEQFSSKLIAYPWSLITVVDPPLDAEGAAGMEHPTLVTTSGDQALVRPGMRLPEYVTIHEIGHQWFQGMLASNESVEPWLDEGVNEWMDEHVMTSLYGPNHSALDWMGWQADGLPLRRALSNAPHRSTNPIASPASAFSNQAAYGNVVYNNTLFALATLENLKGETRMQSAIAQYAKQWAFAHPTADDLKASLGAQLGNIDDFFGPVFQRNAGLDLSVASFGCQPLMSKAGIFDDNNPITAVATGALRCDVLLENASTLSVPVDVEVKFDDGSFERMQWPANSGRWHRFSVQRTSKIAEVTIDPERKLVMDNQFDNRVRRVRNPDASYRAAARVGFWAQTAMQLVGL
jgi:Peptidase family M1 domain